MSCCHLQGCCSLALSDADLKIFVIPDNFLTFQSAYESPAWVTPRAVIKMSAGYDEVISSLKGKVIKKNDYKSAYVSKFKPNSLLLYIKKLSKKVS